MVVWCSVVLQMPQLPEAIRLAVIFSAPSASFVGMIFGWIYLLRLFVVAGRKIRLITFVHLLPDRATAEALAGIR